MNELVIDTCVVTKWFLPEINSDRALMLRDESRAGVVNLLAPDLLLTEFAHVLWKHRQSLDLEEIETMSAELRAWELDFVTSTDLIETALILACDHSRSVYDALYLALAQRRDCDFITAESGSTTRSKINCLG